MHTTGLRRARIVGADVLIIATQRTAPLALALSASINGSTDIAVIAGSSIVGVNATTRRVAGIAGARVRIITIKPPLANAKATRAQIVESARVAIVTFAVVGDVLTAFLGIAGIAGAVVLVVAGHRDLALTLALDTRVCRRAEVLIVAWCAVMGVQTTALRITRIIGADIAIIAVYEPLEKAITATAMIAEGTVVTIVAGLSIGHEGATAVVVAAIVSAAIGIVANHRHPAPAFAFETGITHGARVAIIAGETLVIRHQCTFARPRVT